MKVTVTIDCTPEEARAAMGLPDLTPVHDRYLQLLTETMDSGTRPELLEQMVRTWAPMGEAGLSLWRRMIEGAAKQG